MLFIFDKLFYIKLTLFNKTVLLKKVKFVDMKDITKNEEDNCNFNNVFVLFFGICTKYKYTDNNRK